ncbi:MAG: hypothetical protein QW678_01935 [Candidatus Aenigmatarchaeota archaeon]
MKIKISKKVLVMLSTILIIFLFLSSYLPSYVNNSYSSFLSEENINFFEPTRELKIYLLQKGKTIVLIYGYSNISINELNNLVEIFSKNVYFFLINSSITQAFIISPIYEKTIFNISYYNLLKELCRASLEAPIECIEII